MNQINPAFVMPDVQSTPDTRQIAIQRVSVKGVRHPLTVRTPNGVQPSVGVWNLASAGGTEGHAHVALLASMLTKLEAHSERIEVSLPYFVMKTAPVSGVQSLLDYEVSFVAEKRDGDTRMSMKVLVPVTSLCPRARRRFRSTARTISARM